MEAPNDTKVPIKHFHITVAEPFHRRVKMLCAIQGATMKEYARQALEEKVARDEKEIARNR